MGGLWDCCIKPDDSFHHKCAFEKGYISWVWRRKFHEAYEIGRMLGQGSFATVYEVIDRDDEKRYAGKIVSRHRLHSSNDLRHFENEVRILQDLSHPHIIQLHELYKTRDQYVVITELLHGGELFERLCEKECYTEMEARNVVRTVFEAVAFLHERNIAHRDLKPENLLLVERTDDMQVKIADFGLAVNVTTPCSLVTMCGSPPFMAPEIVNHQNYDERVDHWSLGVIVYYLLGGYNPFHMDSVRATYQQIRQGAYQFNAEDWDGISPDAKHMIAGLLTRNVHQRTTVQSCLLHPWMTGRGDDLIQQNYVNLDKMKESVQKRSGPVRSVSMFWLLSRR